MTKDNVTMCFEQSTKTKSNGCTSQDLIKPVSQIDKSTQTTEIMHSPHAEAGPSTPSTSRYSSPNTTPPAVMMEIQKKMLVNKLW